MQERVNFLTANGMPLEAVAKAVVSHPQVSPATVHCPIALTIDSWAALGCNSRQADMLLLS